MDSCLLWYWAAGAARDNPRTSCHCSRGQDTSSVPSGVAAAIGGLLMLGMYSGIGKAGPCHVPEIIPASSILMDDRRDCTASCSWA